MASNPEQPLADDPIAGLRKLAGLAKELGVNDISAFTEALDAARNDGRGNDVFKPIKAMVEQFATGQMDSAKALSDLGARLKDIVAGRDNLGEVERRTEIALLRRIEELATTAPIAGMVELATAFAQIRAGAPYGDDAPRRS